MSYGAPPVAVFTQRISTRITPEVRERAEAAAAQHGWSLSDWLRVVIETATLDPEPPRKTAPRRRPGLPPA